MAVERNNNNIFTNNSFLTKLFLFIWTPHGEWYTFRKLIKYMDLTCENVFGDCYLSTVSTTSFVKWLSQAFDSLNPVVLTNNNMHVISHVLKQHYLSHVWCYQTPPHGWHEMNWKLIVFLAQANVYFIVNLFALNKRYLLKRRSAYAVDRIDLYHARDKPSFELQSSSSDKRNV